MEQHKVSLQDAGLRLAVVGIGEPKHARRYCGALAPSLTCLCNRTLEAYRAFGLREGSLAQLAGPQVFAAGARAAARGQVQGQATGNQLMLGGVFIIDQGGAVRFADYDEYAGDHPQFSTILAAVQALKLGDPPH